MQKVKTRVLSVFVALTLVMTMLVGLPTAAHAATASIDVTLNTGSIGDGTVNVSSPPGDAAWSYDASQKTLYLVEAAGEYTLTGTNSDLKVRVDSGAAGATVILNGVSITKTINLNSPCLGVNADCTITLQGSNLLHNANADGLGIGSGNNCTINGSGSLSITADDTLAKAGINLSSDATLSISDTATVSAECLNASLGYGINAYNGVTINVASGATLNAKGPHGFSPNTTVSLTLNVNGALNVEATSGTVFTSVTNYILAGNGTITLTGATGERVFNASIANINMDDTITLVVNSSDTAARTVSFTKSSAANTHQWKLTSATFVSPSVATDATVSVSIPVGASTITRELRPVCEIVGGAQYLTLDAALAVVADNQTIRLLNNVTLTADLEIDIGKTFTLDTNGKTLDFNDKGLVISDSSEVSFIGCSKFVDLGWISVFDDGTKAEFDGGLVLTGGCLYAEDDVVVVVNGNLDSQNSDGVIACNGATVTVEGDIYAAAGGVYADSGAKVSVGGITAGSDGVYADGATVTVASGITAGWNGVYISSGSPTVVVVDGEIYAGECGVLIDSWDGLTREADVTVNSDIFAGYAGVWAWYCEDSIVTVNGNITADYIGVFAWTGVEVFINGDIVVTENAALSPTDILVGVAAGFGAEVTVDGTITVLEGHYIALYFEDVSSGLYSYIFVAPNENVSSSKASFLEYNDSDELQLASTVWVKDPATLVPGTGDSTTLWLLLGALMVAALGTGLVLAYRRREQQEV